MQQRRRALPPRPPSPAAPPLGQANSGRFMVKICLNHNYEVSIGEEEKNRSLPAISTFQCGRSI